MNLLKEIATTVESEILWRTIRRIMGSEISENNIILNENGALLERDHVFKGFLGNLKELLKLSTKTMKTLIRIAKRG